MDFPLSDLYEAIGDTCIYTPPGGVATSLPAVLDARPAEALSGEQISTRYEVRVPAVAVSGSVARGATFEFAGVRYQATQAGQPIFDRAELSVPCKVL